MSEPLGESAETLVSSPDVSLVASSDCSVSSTLGVGVGVAVSFSASSSDLSEYSRLKFLST